MFQQKCIELKNKNDKNQWLMTALMVKKVTS